MTKPKKFVFVLMPFDQKFKDTYELGIKQTCKELDAYCERVDEQIFTERILDRIYNQISKADILIADMSDRNPNVFYEVGYAHGLGKNVILLTNHADDIPFDFKHFTHIVYSGQIVVLKDQLRRHLEYFINKDEKEILYNDIDGLDFLIGGEKIENARQFDLSGASRLSDYEIRMQIDIVNNSNYPSQSKFQIGLEIPIEFQDQISSVGNLQCIKPSLDKALFMSRKKFKNIFPGSFKHLYFVINRPSSDAGESVKIIPVKLKIFSNAILKEIDFSFSVPVSSYPRY